MFPVFFSSKYPIRKPADADAPVSKVPAQSNLPCPLHISIVCMYTTCRCHHRTGPWPPFVMSRGLICPKLPLSQLLEMQIRFTFFPTMSEKKPFLFSLIITPKICCKVSSHPDGQNCLQ